MSLGSDLWVWASVSDYLQDYFADLTDVTLADEDNNSIPTDDANRATGAAMYIGLEAIVKN